MKLHSIIGLAAAGLFFAGAGLAIAQTVPLTPVTSVGPSDLFADVVGGSPSAQSKFATAAQIAGVPGYHNFGTISADPAYTVPNGVTDLFAHAAGTLTLATITTEPNPADGKRECWWLDAATTTLTWTANTGQTISANVHAAGVAFNPNCITFVAALSSWVSSP
jgi:hypothetical protein